MHGGNARVLVWSSQGKACLPLRCTARTGVSGCSKQSITIQRKHLNMEPQKPFVEVESVAADPCRVPC